MLARRLVVVPASLVPSAVERKLPERVYDVPVAAPRMGATKVLSLNVCAPDKRTTSIPSTAILPAADRDKVVSVAWPSSMLPSNLTLPSSTHKGQLLEPSVGA